MGWRIINPPGHARLLFGETKSMVRWLAALDHLTRGIVDSFPLCLL
jgi:hypothetical protein